MEEEVGETHGSFERLVPGRDVVVMKVLDAVVFPCIDVGRGDLPFTECWRGLVDGGDNCFSSQHSGVTNEGCEGGRR